MLAKLVIGAKRRPNVVRNRQTRDRFRTTSAGKLGCCRPSSTNFGPNLGPASDRLGAWSGACVGQLWARMSVNFGRNSRVPTEFGHIRARSTASGPSSIEVGRFRRKRQKIAEFDQDSTIASQFATLQLVKAGGQHEARSASATCPGKATTIKHCAFRSRPIAQRAPTTTSVS